MEMSLRMGFQFSRSAMKLLLAALFVIVQSETTIMNKLHTYREANEYGFLWYSPNYNQIYYQNDTPRHTSSQNLIPGVIREINSTSAPLQDEASGSSMDADLDEMQNNTIPVVNNSLNLGITEEKEFNNVPSITKNAYGDKEILKSVTTMITPTHVGVLAQNLVSPKQVVSPLFERGNAKSSNTPLLVNKSQSHVKDQYKSPIQILPSQLPAPIEKIVERIQNYFSTYNYPELQNKPLTPQISTNMKPDVYVKPTTTTENSVLEESTPEPTEDTTTTEDMTISSE